MASKTQDVTSSDAPDQVIERFVALAGHEGWRLVERTPTSAKARKGPTLSSWYENAAVEAEPEGSGSVVHVRVSNLQLLSAGQRRMLERVVAAVSQTG